jgi:8-oxo-dGTP diphosphatase
VVWRPGTNAYRTGDRTADREVIMVHRPRHDDWTLPKGKLEPGELPLVAAVREVWEETAIRPVVGARLPTVYYDVWAKPSGARTAAPALIEKLVDYWAMRAAADDGFVPGPETDVRAWLGVDEALARLSYPHDVKVLAAFSELPMLRDPVVLLRHSSAGDRDSFPGPDIARPLDPKGISRAEDLVVPLSCYAPARLIAATPERCVQTLRPLAQALRLPIERDPAFDEDADPLAAAQRLRALADTDAPAVVCSQGRLIPSALAALTARPPSTYRTAKGDGWVLSFSDKGLAALDKLDA